MAKSDKTERLIFCSGRDWSGDGSKASSPCRFERSMVTTANRFKCPYCITGQSPEEIYVDANGVKKMIPKDALNQDESPEVPPPEISPPEILQPDSTDTSEVEVAPQEQAQESARKTKTKRRRPRF